MDSFRARITGLMLTIMILCVLLFVFFPIFVYTQCRIEVPKAHLGILIQKVGNDLDNTQVIAPDETFKGVQKKHLPEGRYFRNPFVWDWVVVPQVHIPVGKLGVRVRLYGENLSPGELIARKETQKGIVEQPLRAGRHEINAWVVGTERREYDSYAEHIELFYPVTIDAGFKGVVTNLSGQMPKDPNVLLVEEGERGVQLKSLDPGTYYINPYVERIHLVDCRVQKFNLSDDGGSAMGFPSKDGFWVSLNADIQFRVMPDQASKVYVIYNDTDNGEVLDEEIISKIILPNARSFCRLQGSSHSGKDFISGETREKFQKDFGEAMKKTCETQGIEVIQALIKETYPPEQIAEPVRTRQLALQTEEQYQREIKQQTAEQELAVQNEMVKRKQELISVEQEVVVLVTEAMREQEVAVIEANQRLKVAEFELKAAEDEAAAITALGQAAAEVVHFDNEAEAAGWKRAVEAFSGDGHEYARWVFLQKMAPAFRGMMVNTSDSPLMNIFSEYQSPETRLEPIEPTGPPRQSRLLPLEPVVETPSVVETPLESLDNPTEEPTEDQPTEVKPTEDQPTEDQPTEVKPTEVKPTEDQPTEVKPTEDQPTEDQPTEDQPTEVKPTEDQPTEVKPTEDQPTEVKPTEVKPTEVKPAEDQPTEPVESM